MSAEHEADPEGYVKDPLHYLHCLEYLVVSSPVPIFLYMSWRSDADVGRRRGLCVQRTTP